MENNSLEQLKNIWQSQKTKSANFINIEKEMAELIKKLKSFERKQFRINIAKTFGVSTLMLLLAWTILERVSATFTTVAGLLFVIVSTIIFMLVYWKKQFRVNTVDMGKTSSAFVKSAIEKLKEEKKLFRIYFPLLIVCMIGGLNIIYYGMFGKLDILTRMLYHSSMTVVLTIAAFVGMRIRIKRYENKFLPLINSLKSIYKDFHTGDESK